MTGRVGQAVAQSHADALSGKLGKVNRADRDRAIPVGGDDSIPAAKRRNTTAQGAALGSRGAMIDQALEGRNRPGSFALSGLRRAGAIPFPGLRPGLSCFAASRLAEVAAPAWASFRAAGFPQFPGQYWDKPAVAPNPKIWRRQSTRAPSPGSPCRRRCRRSREG
jgi:hypothetical protein